MNNKITNKQFSKIYVFLDDKGLGFPTKTKYEFNQEEFEGLNQAGYGVFQSVNSFDLTKELTDKTYRCEKYLSNLDYVYGDLDIAKQKDGLINEQKKLKKEAKLQEVLPFKPTMVIETANGIQPYWKISDGAVTAESKLKCENIIWAIINKFDGDPGAKDLSRILRIPNFYHNKDTPFLCKIIYEADVSYTLNELAAIFPFTAQTNETIKNKVDFWEALKQGFPDGNRHSAFLSLCLSMLRGKPEKDWANVWLLMESTYYQNVKDTDGFPIKDAKICFEKACEYRRGWDKDGPEQKEYKIVSINDLLAMTPKENPFLLQGMIVEGSINALTSDSGKGKSLLALKAIESIVKGENFLGQFKTRKSKTLIIDLEMSENDIIQRTQNIIGEKMEGLDFYHCQAFNICDEEDYRWLQETITKNEYKLVVIDTYSMAHNKNENDNTETNIVNHKLLDLINACGVTILFLHHHRKLAKGETMSQSSSRGATDIIGKTASHLLLDTRDIIMAIGDEHNRTEARGIRIIIEQMKRRQATGFERFAVKVWYDEFKKRTYFEFDGFDEKADSAIEKIIGLLLKKLKPGEEYLMSEITEMVGKSSVVYSALKVLVEDQKKVGIRSPQDGEMKDGVRVRHNAKIYYLT